MMKDVFILVLVPMYDVSEYDVSTYQCTVLLYHPFIYQCTGVYMYVSMYWRVYVCMYVSVKVYVSMFQNQSYFNPAKKVRTKCILRAKYMY